jgi:CubicO group peptidase (beta-lactamase class C family)
MSKYLLALSLLLPLLASYLYLNWGLLFHFLKERINMGQSSSSTYCPPPGASLPPPTIPAIQNLGFDVFPDASSFLSQVQNEAWYPTTTFAIQASIGGETVFKHASYRTVSNHTGDVTGLFEKQTRIGSITKAFTVLAVLLSKDKIRWDDSITKHVPSLNEDAYRDVTIAAIAGQTSGLGRYVCDIRHYI